MEIRNVLERLKLLTNDDREDLLLMLSGDAVQRLKARLCCTEEEENAHEDALCAAAAAQAADRGNTAAPAVGRADASAPGRACAGIARRALGYNGYTSFGPPSRPPCCFSAPPAICEMRAMRIARSSFSRRSGRR